MVQSGPNMAKLLRRPDVCARSTAAGLPGKDPSRTHFLDKWGRAILDARGTSDCFGQSAVASNNVRRSRLYQHGGANGAESCPAHRVEELPRVGEQVDCFDSRPQSLDQRQNNEVADHHDRCSDLHNHSRGDE